MAVVPVSSLDVCNPQSEFSLFRCLCMFILSSLFMYFVSQAFVKKPYWSIVCHVTHKYFFVFQSFAVDESQLTEHDDRTRELEDILSQHIHELRAMTDATLSKYNVTNVQCNSRQQLLCYLQENSKIWKILFLNAYAGLLDVHFTFFYEILSPVSRACETASQLSIGLLGSNL